MLKYRKIYFTISGTLVLASLIFLVVFGLKLGIDFTGGSLMEVTVSDPNISAFDIENVLENSNDLDLGDVRVQPTKSSVDKNLAGFLIRMRDIREEEHQKVLNILSSSFKKEANRGKENKESKNSENTENENTIKEIRFESIGPVIGEELKKKALWQIVLVAFGIVLYIAYAFRNVSKVKEGSRISWKFGIVALAALLHDVIITLGVFSILCKFLGVEIDNSFIAAILLVLGYSVNDTIVVFDRIRENLIKNKYSSDLKGIINESVRSTIVRSINTSLTTLLVLFSILFFGGKPIFYFVLALIIGIGIGTYSSIFLAAPLLYEWEKEAD